MEVLDLSEVTVSRHAKKRFRERHMKYIGEPPECFISEAKRCLKQAREIQPPPFKLYYGRRYVEGKNGFAFILSPQLTAVVTVLRIGERIKPKSKYAPATRQRSLGLPKQKRTTRNPANRATAAAQSP